MLGVDGQYLEKVSLLTIVLKFIQHTLQRYQILANHLENIDITMIYHIVLANQCIYLKTYKILYSSST